MNWRIFDFSLKKFSMAVNYMKYKDGKRYKEICLNITSEKGKNTQSWGLIQGIKHGHNMLLSWIKGQENENYSELTHTEKRSEPHPGAQVHKYNEQQT